MTRPIKETPTLYGEDARRFAYAVEHPRKVTAEEMRRMKESYELMKSIANFAFWSVDAYRDATKFYEKNGFEYFTTLDVLDSTRLMYFDLKDIKDQLQKEQ